MVTEPEMSSRSARIRKRRRHENKIRDYQLWSQVNTGTFEEWRALCRRWVASCGSGSLESVQQDYATLDVVGHYWSKGLHRACSHGNLPVVRWCCVDLVASGKVDPLWEERCRLWAALFGQLETLQWLCSRLPVKECQETLIDLWHGTCYHGNLKTAQWLWGLKVDYRQAIPKVWRSVCRRGHLELAQWLWGSEGLDPDRAVLDAWICASRWGQLAILQWMYTEGRGPAGAWLTSWRMGCFHGQLEVVRWMWSAIVPPRHSVFSPGEVVYEGWVRACRGGQLHVVQWLWSVGRQLGRLDPDSLEDGWENAVRRGRLEIMCWIVEQAADGSLALETRCPRLWDTIQTWSRRRHVKSARSALAPTISSGDHR